MITTTQAPPSRLPPFAPDDEADDALDSTFPTSEFPFDGARFPPPLGGGTGGRTIL